MENGTTPLVAITRATLRELPQVRDFWIDMLREQRDKPFYPPPAPTDDDYLTQDLAVTLQDVANFGAFLAHTADGTLVGMVACEVQYRRFGLPARYGYFNAIYVLPEYRHHDVSLRLCQTVVRWLLEVGCDLLEIDNPAGYAPWWKVVGMPFKVTRTHCVGKITDLITAVSAYTAKRHPIHAVQVEPVEATIDSLPDTIEEEP